MLKPIKNVLRPSYRKLRDLVRQQRGLLPALEVSSHPGTLVRLGTTYGGWAFIDHDRLENSVIVSCGLGEDASFDVQFAARYGAKVIVVDPTPRAIEHFKGIQSRIGSLPEEKYADDAGAQSIGAYDLSTLSSTQLQLCERALWNEDTRLRFFLPANPDHVSHSIINYQNSYSSSSPSIEVETITIDKLLEKYDIDRLEIIKLDIEGAEVEVLTDMLEKRIHPLQVLVEYDELSVPSRRTKDRIQSVHQKLVDANYRLVNRENLNFTYVLG